MCSTTSGTTTSRARCCSTPCAARPSAACACGCCWTTTTRAASTTPWRRSTRNPTSRSGCSIRSCRGRGARSDISSISRALNRRMHNKSFTADNQATIVGGRNVGDEYFGAGQRVLFADLDVLAVGPVVDDVSRDFDRYWASGSSYPVNRLLPAARAAPSPSWPRPPRPSNTSPPRWRIRRRSRSRRSCAAFSRAA